MISNIIITHVDGTITEIPLADDITDHDDYFLIICGDKTNAVMKDFVKTISYIK